MKYILVPVTFGLCAFAAILPRVTPPLTRCCFSLIGIGLSTGPSPVIENTIGENELNSTSFPRGSYCVGTAQPGVLTDYADHTCIISISSKQFQCANGIQSAANFTIADDQNLLADGCPNFWACPSTGAGAAGVYDLFADTKSDTSGCQAVVLKTGGYDCAALGRPSESALPPSTSTKTVEVASATISNAVPVTPFLPTTDSTKASPTIAGSCPTDISAGTFAPPNLIIPVSQRQHDTQFGTSYYPRVDTDQSTLFSFDIPSSYIGTCALIFTFPYGNQALFSYFFSGIEEETEATGGLEFAYLDDLISNSTSYDSKPNVSKDLGKTVIIPGNNYTIATFPCQSGKKVAYSMSSVGNVALNYFQSSAKTPIGAWVVPCV